MRGDPESTVELADVLLAHPAVARLDGGLLGTVASHLPGRRLPGVRVGAAGEPVELAVVVRPGFPLPDLARELAGLVRDRLGPVPVEVAFVDVELPAAAGPGAADRAHRLRGGLT